MNYWNIEAFNGYVPKTTFWSDFEIAEAFGKNAVLETYDTAMKHWSSNHIYLTELVLVLNHRLWMHYERGNNALAEIYDNLWRKANSFAMETLKGDDLRYFLEVTD